MELCDYCGSGVDPDDAYELVHGHRCSTDIVSSVSNTFANMLAAMTGGDTREKRFVVHRDCVKQLFVYREIRRRTK